MVEIRKKIVYFLGAGASLGAGAVAPIQGGGSLPIPTQADFWETFIRFSKSLKNRRAIESFLFKYFLGYSKFPSKLSPDRRRRLLAGIDVEEVFTFISERRQAPSTSVSMKTVCKNVWVALVEELPNVFNRFPANVETKSHYRQFLKNHLRSFDTVVSFNYDTVFENSLPKNASYFYPDISGKSARVRVLKPHGSINWREVDDAVIVEEAPGQALVVAPTHLKFVQTLPAKSNDADLDTELKRVDAGYLDGSKTLRNVWYQMEAEMKSAKALVFIGYSFPVADLYFSSVVRSVLADRGKAPGLVIVNPDARAIRERLQSRFPLSKISLYYDLTTFCQAKRSDVLDAIL